MFAKYRHHLFLCLLCTISSCAFAGKPPILPIQKWLTKSGTQVLYVYEPELPIIDIQVAFDAGSARDGTYKGVAKMTNEALSVGTAKKNANEIAASFDDVGAIYSAAVSRDMAVVALRSLTDPKFLQPAFNNFAQVLTNPVFPSAEFSRVQKQLLSSLEQQEEQPASIAAKAFYNAVYDNNPYGHPVSGTTRSVTKLTRQDAQRFYHTYYVAQNALIAIVGNVDKNHAEKLAEELSARLGKGSKPEQLVFKSFDQAKTFQHITFPSSQTHVMMGQTGINRTDAAYFPVMVGNYILGGGSLTSRLFDEVREKRGLAYSVYSQFSALKEKGPFLIELQTRTSEANNAIKVVNETLTDFIKKGPAETELQAAKKNLTQGFILHLASNAAVAGQLINIGFYGLPLNYFDTYQENINKVSGQGIKDVFQKILQPQSLITITVGK